MNPTIQPVKLNRADGVCIEFTKLSPNDHLALREKLRLRRKMMFCESLIFAGIEGIERVKALNEFDAKPMSYDVIVDHVNTPEGQADAILMSLQKTNAKATIDDVAALDLDLSESLEVAAGVCNLTLRVIAPLPASVGSPSTETSDAMQPSSDTSVEPTTTP